MQITLVFQIVILCNKLKVTCEGPQWPLFIRPFEKQDVLWEHLRRAGRRHLQGFHSKSKSFYPVFIKLGEYVGGHNISTKVYNSQIPLGTPKLQPLNCPKLGFPLSQRVFIRPLSNLVNMLVGIISRPSSITCQIPLGTPKLQPLNCPKLGFPPSQKVSIRSLSNLVHMLVGISPPSSITCQIPPGTPELWPWNCPKTELAVSDGKYCSHKCCHYH